MTPWPLQWFAGLALTAAITVAIDNQACFHFLGNHMTQPSQKRAAAPHNPKVPLPSISGAPHTTPTFNTVRASAHSGWATVVLVSGDHQILPVRGQAGCPDKQSVGGHIPNPGPIPDPPHQVPSTPAPVHLAVPVPSQEAPADPLPLTRVGPESPEILVPNAPLYTPMSPSSAIATFSASVPPLCPWYPSTAS